MHHESRFTHTICGPCWLRKFSDQIPTLNPSTNHITCCFCGQDTDAGFLIGSHPDYLHCARPRDTSPMSSETHPEQTQTIRLYTGTEVLYTCTLKYLYNEWLITNITPEPPTEIVRLYLKRLVLSAMVFKGLRPEHGAVDQLQFVPET